MSDVNQPRHGNRVLVTGLGVVCGLGMNWQSMWDGLVNGRSAIQAWSPPDVPNFPVGYAAPVDDQAFTALFPDFAALTQLCQSSREGCDARCSGIVLCDKQSASMIIDGRPAWSSLGDRILSCQYRAEGVRGAVFPLSVWHRFPALLHDRGRYMAEMRDPARGDQRIEVRRNSRFSASPGIPQGRDVTARRQYHAGSRHDY